MTMRGGLPVAALALSIGLAGCAGSRYYLSPCPPDAAGAVRPGVPAGFGCHDPLVPEAGGPGVRLSVFLVGDAGTGDETDPTSDPRSLVLRHLTEQLGDESVPDRRVIFLGDNIYPNGLRFRLEPGCDSEDEAGLGFAGEFCPEDQSQLEAQIRAVPSGVLAYFIPGNHDWANTKARTAYYTLRNQQTYLDRRAEALSVPDPAPVFVPRAGCPGPVHVPVPDATDPAAHLIFVDSQWLLLPRRVRPQRHAPEEVSQCSSSSEEDFYASLASVLEAAGDVPVVLATHHPMRTYSKHGGARNYRFGFGFHPQDVNGPRYSEMIDRFDALIANRRSRGLVVLAAGHDHVLQVFGDRLPSVYHAVSGAGSKGASALDPDPEDDAFVFGASLSGFMRVDFRSDGSAYLYVYAGCQESVTGEWDAGRACSANQFGTVHAMRLETGQTGVMER